MDIPEFLMVRATIWIAVGAWAYAVARRLTVGSDRCARLGYTLGLAAYVAHMIAAFAGPYGWSWERALAETARISAEKVGVATANGLWWNVVFAGVWLLDGLCWWVQGLSGYSAGRGWWRWGVDVFMTFMVFNGAVVFAAGPVRWYGSVLFGMIAVLGARRIFRGPCGAWPRAKKEPAQSAGS